MITEGLVHYFGREAVTGLWSRVAELLRGYPGGLYLSDLHLGEDGSGLLPRIALGFVPAAGSSYPR